MELGKCTVFLKGVLGRIETDDPKAVPMRIVPTKEMPEFAHLAPEPGEQPDGGYLLGCYFVLVGMPPYTKILP